MAKEHSMDITIQFDFQELKNAVEQTKKEAVNRFDLKDANVEIELSEDNIKITAQSEMQIDSIHGILIKKMISRSVSPLVLKREPAKEIGGMRMREEMKLIKALDQENGKKIANIIRESFPKSKPNIQGDTVRVTSQSIDELQQIIATLRADEKLALPLEFGNYR
ncbi:YajQ family cyclic di-GMP-binding protein [Candidatus Peregrinibacteria bacterium CG10_big_fil_rev_8_21_14_0_10_36_19]|nr:MAG: YajQ family cyclic di-GMP-binding protein [Candidatus Peregrinibacteria bacterium CG10_big_fil_rev_8_21_14_0_10_36_19]